MNSSLAAAGRMDVVEQALASDPFYKTKLQNSPRHKVKNRLGRVRSYSELTFKLVNRMAQRGLDPVKMRQHELQVSAFKLLADEKPKVLVA
jgi:hypothetical protein